MTARYVTPAWTGPSSPQGPVLMPDPPRPPPQDPGTPIRPWPRPPGPVDPKPIR